MKNCNCCILQVLLHPLLLARLNSTHLLCVLAHANVWIHPYASNFFSWGVITSVAKSFMGYQFMAIFKCAAFYRTSFPQSFVNSEQEFVPDRHYSLHMPLPCTILSLEWTVLIFHHPCCPFLVSWVWTWQGQNSYVASVKQAWGLEPQHWKCVSFKCAEGLQGALAIF